jgi:hypothetical protein
MTNQVLWRFLLATPVAGALLTLPTAAIALDNTTTDLATSTTIELSTTETIPTLPVAMDSGNRDIVTPTVDLSDRTEFANLNTTEPFALADASTTEQGNEDLPTTGAIHSDTPVLDVSAFSETASTATADNAMAQVTSVTQLSDVQPTDWAYQALQSLVERYGCIAGYPDGTFRGNRPMTRYEFAAGLNACLDRINELIAQGLGVSPDDLAAISRLQEDFAAQLATLRGRVDSLEARLAEVEANQFSTTTKLNGHVIFNTAAVFDEDEAFDDQVTFGYQVRMNFDASFTGDDRLRIRLQGRDVQDFAGDPVGFSYSGTSLAGNGDTDNIELDNLFYDFPVGDRIQVRIGANGLDVDELVASTISPLDSSTGGSLSNFGFPAQYYVAAPGDAGAGLIYQLTDNLSLDLGYTAGGSTDPASPVRGQGLFNGDYSMIAQLTYLSGRFDAALTYIHAYAQEGLDGLSATPVYANTYGAQVNFRISSGFEVGGGVSYTDANSLLFGSTGTEVWSYQGTLAFPDLGGDGNMLGFLFGVPPRIADVEVGGNRVPFLIEDAAFLVEGFYRFQVNDRISVTPSVIWISDPFNNNDIDDSIIGAIRTTFEF